MILGKLELNESAEMEFEAEIFGTIDKPTSIRYIIEGPDFEIGCECLEEGKNIKVQIPKLKGILPSGVYESRLEVIINDKLFVPMRESIEFNPNIELDVKTKGIKSIKEGIKITTKVTSEDSKTNKELDNLLSEGYEVVNMNKFHVLKKNEKYCGIVSENKVIKSDKSYSTLSDLVTALSK